MVKKESATSFSSSGKVEYASTNYVAFMEKESVHKDFHPLMDFLKISPVTYALTASPTIYAEIVQEMWNTACCSEAEIKLKINGKSYTITPSLINEALHLPNANFETLPTDEEIISMLNSIKYASEISHLGQVRRPYLRKEWSYFFDTLIKVFTGKCSGFDSITTYVQKIAYSLIYGRAINIGSLLLNEFSYKLGDMVKRGKIIYYARFFMIIANHLQKDLSIKNKDDQLQVCVQAKRLFAQLVKNNLNGNVDFVLPRHIQIQLSTLSPSPKSKSRTKGTSSSVSQNGKRKRTNLPTITTYYESITVEGSEEIGAAAEINPPLKKMAADVVKPARRLFSVDHGTPRVTRNRVPVVELTSSEEEYPKCDLPPVEPSLEQNSQEVLPDDREQLMNAASVLKCQLVAQLTSSAEKLRTEDMNDLADRCYNTLRGLGDDYTSIRRKVHKLIGQHQKLEDAARNKDNWNDQDIKARYSQQVVSLSNMTKKLSGTEEKLSRAKNKKEEIKAALLRLREELSDEEERVKTLTEERDICKADHSDVEAKFEKLVAEKKEAYKEFEAINGQYNNAKKEYERMSNQLMQSVGK
ncbi:hypothetical protein DCAR_0104360 [Daucus carota subsp. sativus]|uniref:Uncharacterized protein n=1 Tax=Daucus carota subsp. sativus TaxID=79200 RepID=A0AAF0WBC2_DAUCS|nr:PREDICTED: uncharacterized protein LOC108197623 [Daucus carota subsp. sativus]WOG85173.1 hypothetical protein DCAR_0104360 [Daucus carota subsp. sativus]